MTAHNRMRSRGFTLIELLATLLILSLLSLMSYRGLSAILDAREHVTREADKWRSVALFFARFEDDTQLAAPRAVRTVSGVAPAWLASPDANGRARLEFSRYASGAGMDTPRRLAYRLNERQQVELWIWPSLDVAPGVAPLRYPLLDGVSKFELQYLTADLAWVDAWPATARDAAIPQALRLRIVLSSGEDIVRVLALR